MQHCGLRFHMLECPRVTPTYEGQKFVGRLPSQSHGESSCLCAQWSQILLATWRLESCLGMTWRDRIQKQIPVFDSPLRLLSSHVLFTRTGRNCFYKERTFYQKQKCQKSDLRFEKKNPNFSEVKKIPKT